MLSVGPMAVGTWAISRTYGGGDMGYHNIAHMLGQSSDLSTRLQ